MSNSKLVGGAGEHYVAYVLSCFNFVCALVREGSPTVDLLASDIDGNSTISIQVKTSTSARRKRGRGENRQWNHLEFTLGKKAIQNSSDTFFFCFVDLKGLEPSTTPDVYIIPSNVIRDHYSRRNVEEIKWLRLHWSIEKMEPYKNNWTPIRTALESKAAKT